MASIQKDIPLPAPAAEVWDAVRGLVATGTDIVLTTHQLDEADELADQIVVIDHGAVIAAGSVTQIKAGIGRDVIEIALSDAAEVLRDIGLGKGPAKSLIAFGYAGWAPEQLDDEIKSGAWGEIPEDPALVFDDDRSKVCADALAQQKVGK